MAVWIIAVSLAGLFFFQGDAIVLFVFSKSLTHDTFGLVGKIVGIIVFCAKYFLPLFILTLTYNIRNHQVMLVQSRVEGAPRCPRCGRRMVFRTAAFGFFFWDHFWSCPFCRCQESIGPWEIDD